MYNSNWRNPFATAINQTPLPREKTIREELEEQFRLEEERQRQQSLIPKPDYSNMSLREELEARFRDLDNQQNNQSIAPAPTAQPQANINQASPLPQGFNSYSPVPNQPATPWHSGYQNYASSPVKPLTNDENLINVIFPDLLKHERGVEYMYLDTQGYKTVGIGKNVDDWDNFTNINWTVDGRPATFSEKLAAFSKFEEMKQNNEYGQKRGAGTYKDLSSLRIADEEIKRLATEHLKKNIKYLHNEFSDFDSYPLGLKKVLLDMTYNTGSVTEENWPKLHKAIKARNLTDIRKHIHRKHIAESRNQWAEQQIDSIVKW